MVGEPYQKPFEGQKRLHRSQFSSQDIDASHAGLCYFFDVKPHWLLDNGQEDVRNDINIVGRCVAQASYRILTVMKLANTLHGLKY